MVSLVPHRADDDNDLVALLLRSNRLARRVENLFGVGNAGAAEFLNDQRHGLIRKGWMFTTESPRHGEDRQEEAADGRKSTQIRRRGKEFSSKPSPISSSTRINLRASASICGSISCLPYA